MKKSTPAKQAKQKDTADIRPEDKTTIAPEVLLTLIRLAALEVHGVSRMGTVPGGVNRLFKRGYGEGIRINIQENTVYADLYIILKSDVNMRGASRAVQNEVERVITEMVGMHVGRINIHIEDIDYPEQQAQEQAAA